jgi:hypothetical protein
MTNEHPITPPQELVDEWLCDDGYPCDPSANSVITITTGRLRNVAAKAARWGADQELGACGEWIRASLKGQLRPADRIADDLRAARRPKPPSLKEQALEALARQERGRDRGFLSPEAMADADTIRRAIEALPDTP